MRNRNTRAEEGSIKFLILYMCGSILSVRIYPNRNRLDAQKSCRVSKYRCTDGMVPRPTSPKQDVAVKQEEERPIDALSSLTVSSNSSSASAAFARSLFLFLGMSFWGFEGKD